MTDSESGAPIRRDKLHGRRRGRKLRLGQQGRLETDLPRVRLDLDLLRRDGPAALFGSPPTRLWLEVGFGGGEHLAWQATTHPETGLIGCEVYETGIATLLGHLEADNVRNVRVVTEDARLVLDLLPDAALDRVFILFPDPWPKTRHHKRRFVSPATMAALARVMKDGAELRLATDDPAYLRVMLAVACGHPDFEWLARRPADWQERPADWPATRYEAKAIAQGRRPAFLRLNRRPRI